MEDKNFIYLIKCVKLMTKEVSYLRSVLLLKSNFYSLRNFYSCEKFHKFIASLECFLLSMPYERFQHTKQLKNFDVMSTFINVS